MSRSSCARATGYISGGVNDCYEKTTRNARRSLDSTLEGQSNVRKVQIVVASAALRRRGAKAGLVDEEGAGRYPGISWV